MAGAATSARAWHGWAGVGVHIGYRWPVAAICERCGLEVAWDPEANVYVAEDDPGECEHAPPVGRHRAG